MALQLTVTFTSYASSLKAFGTNLSSAQPFESNSSSTGPHEHPSDPAYSTLRGSSIDTVSPAVASLKAPIEFSVDI
eukprot:5024438-Prymnesium_polylepis.2